MFQCCVGVSVHGDALRAHREGRKEQRAEPDAEEERVRRARDVRGVHPSIREREDMAEQAVGVRNGGATSLGIRFVQEARVGPSRRGREGCRGTSRGLRACVGSFSEDRVGKKFMEFVRTWKRQGARTKVDRRGTIVFRGWRKSGAEFGGGRKNGGGSTHRNSSWIRSVGFGSLEGKEEGLR